MNKKEDFLKLRNSIFFYDPPRQISPHLFLIYTMFYYYSGVRIYRNYQQEGEKEN